MGARSTGVAATRAALAALALEYESVAFAGAVEEPGLGSAVRGHAQRAPAAQLPTQEGELDVCPHGMCGAYSAALLGGGVQSEHLPIARPHTQVREGIKLTL